MTPSVDSNSSNPSSSSETITSGDSGNPTACTNSIENNIEQQQQEKDPSSSYYRSRKPKWWTQLSGRRGTRAQRKAIQRMTERGYCLSKDVLTDFSRVNNRARQEKQKQRDDGSDADVIVEDGGQSGTEILASSSCNNESDGLHFQHDDEWKRGWWNRSLGIIPSKETDTSSLLYDPAMTTPDNKYAHKIEQMYNHKNPLPARQYEHIWLEIGFGNGDNLLANSKNHPNNLFMGCEIHQPGVGTVLRQMEMELDQYEKNMNQHALDTGKDADDIMKQPQSQSQLPYQNIRILPGDGIKLLSHLPDNYLDVILITFPDPWPKEHHVRWRVIQSEVLREMHRVLKQSSGRVYVATDAECFDSWTREIFHQESSLGLWKQVVPCPDRATWLPKVSYYEQKGLDEGRFTMLQCWKCCS